MIKKALCLNFIQISTLKCLETSLSNLPHTVECKYSRLKIQFGYITSILKSPILSKVLLNLVKIVNEAWTKYVKERCFVRFLLIQIKTYHFPIKVISAIIIQKSTHARVKGAMALASFSRIKIEIIHGDIATISSSLISFILGYRF